MAIYDILDDFYEYLKEDAVTDIDRAFNEKVEFAIHQFKKHGHAEYMRKKALKAAEDVTNKAHALLKTLSEKYPNVHNIKNTKDIKTLKILDWDRLKENTWHNNAITTGNWWCHLEGCNKEGDPYNDDVEFWIGFDEANNRIDCNFTAGEGMMHYIFDEFYSKDSVDNRYDVICQVNTIQWLNRMIDEGILGR